MGASISIINTPENQPSPIGPQIFYRTWDVCAHLSHLNPNTRAAVALSLPYPSFFFYYTLTQERQRPFSPRLFSPFSLFSHAPQTRPSSAACVPPWTGQRPGGVVGGGRDIRTQACMRAWFNGAGCVCVCVCVCVCRDIRIQACMHVWGDGG
jgi:hypothetical protein